MWETLIGVAATAVLTVIGWVIKAMYAWAKSVSSSLVQIKSNTAAAKVERRSTAARTDRAHERLNKHDEVLNEHGRDLAALKSRPA